MGARLQFERAEYGEQADGSLAGGASCTPCQCKLAHEYYELNSQPICESCRQALEQSLAADSPTGRFLRALAVGSVAGVVGAGIYYAVLALTGYEVGLIAILVGFLVGAGVRWGSRGRGGWPFQVLAAGLTYLAIVSTYIPFMLAPRLGVTSQSAQSPAAPEGQPAATPSTGEGARPGESVKDFTTRITSELRQTDARAADVFAEGNAARDTGDWPTAEGLYRDVLQRQPGFDHATRRLCGVLVRQGRRNEALPLCRQAVEQNPSVFNVAALVEALSAPPASGAAPPAEIAEAVSRARGLLDRTDLDDATVANLCESSAQAGDLALLRRSSARLDRSAPLSLAGAYCGWLLALSVRDFDEAEARLARARGAGLDEKDYQGMLSATRRVRLGPGLGEMAALLLLAMTAPFLDGVGNVIGIAIIAFALFQAWRMNRPVPIRFEGPYRMSEALQDAAGGGGSHAV